MLLCCQYIKHHHIRRKMPHATAWSINKSSMCIWYNWNRGKRPHAVISPAASLVMERKIYSVNFNRGLMQFWDWIYRSMVNCKPSTIAVCTSCTTQHSIQTLRHAAVVTTICNMSTILTAMMKIMPLFDTVVCILVCKSVNDARWTFQLECQQHGINATPCDTETDLICFEVASTPPCMCLILTCCSSQETSPAALHTSHKAIQNVATKCTIVHIQQGVSDHA